jgi:hypothetical protein
MALIGNRSVLHKSPGRFLSGTVASIERSNFSKAGQMSSRFQALNRLSAAIPEGCLPPTCWSLPRATGGMASRFEILGAGSLAGSGALGVNGSASLSGAGGVIFAGLALVVSAVASLVGSGGLTADIVGKLEATASLAGSGDLAGTIGALADLVASLSGSGTVAGTPRADGALSANIRGYGDLTPEGIRDAVWAAALTSINVAGTAGAAVQAAGGGGGAGDPTVGEPVLYKADTTVTMADPGAGDVRWNNATQASATQLAIDLMTDDGLDVTAFAARVAAGDYLRIQDRDDAARFQNWVISASVVESGWLRLTVSLATSGGGNLPNNHPIVLVFTYPASASSDPWAVGLPGAYGAGTAGNILGNLLGAIGTRLIENGMSQDEVTRIMLSALAGKRQGLGTATEQYLSQDNSKPRITLTPDPNGNGDPTVDGT